MQVQFIDLKQRYNEEKDELLACVNNTLSKGSLVMGDGLREFEEKIELYTGASHCIGLNSGTDALMMALWSLDIGKGDEVIHPAISFIATTAAIVHVGATPVFAEVDKDGLIDVAKLESKITSKTKAIMPVHWSGKLCEMAGIIEICERYRLSLIEDSAQAMGAYYNGKHGGTFGTSAAFSCHPLKNFNALGDGGFLITDNAEVSKKVRLYRNHGIESRDNVIMFGVNSRLDTLNAEVLKFRLEKLTSVIDRRRNNANLYRKQIKTEFVRLPQEKLKSGSSDAYVMFLAQVRDRDKLKKYLGENGIETMIYYGTPLHLHKASSRFGHKKGDFPMAEKICDHVLALPIHQYLTKEQIIFVSESINKFYK
jgi:dTDP-4-amino-4,6-dideoxygalactose transaminase